MYSLDGQDLFVCECVFLKMNVCNVGMLAVTCKHSIFYVLSFHITIVI